MSSSLMEESVECTSLAAKSQSLYAQAGRFSRALSLESGMEACGKIRPWYQKYSFDHRKSVGHWVFVKVGNRRCGVGPTHRKIAW